MSSLCRADCDVTSNTVCLVLACLVGFNKALLVQLGHSMVDVYPALTPLLGPHPGGQSIPGVSIEVDAFIQTSKTGKRKASRPGFLFTHRGDALTCPHINSQTLGCFCSIAVILPFGQVRHTWLVCLSPTSPWALAIQSETPITRFGDFACASPCVLQSYTSTAPGTHHHHTP